MVDSVTDNIGIVSYTSLKKTFCGIRHSISLRKEICSGKRKRIWHGYGSLSIAYMLQEISWHITIEVSRDLKKIEWNNTLYRQRNPLPLRVQKYSFQGIHHLRGSRLLNNFTFPFFRKHKRKNKIR